MHDLSANLTVQASPREKSVWLILLKAMLAVAFMHALYVLYIGIDKPLLDMHYFRQTQTALTSYWILKGGPWLAYETPVLGYPWAIPFEFPLFQLLTAAVAWMGVPLDVAGRLVGFSFFLATLWPLRMLYRAIGLGQATWLVTAILYLTSPIYLYWSRTFLVESCALFFSALWLALTAHYFTRPSRYTALAAFVSGCLAVLAKSTTFPAFAVVGGLLILLSLWQSWRAGDPVRHTLRMATVIILNLLLPFVIGLLWVQYSDQIKNLNSVGKMLTSEALTGWNFGNFAQKLSPTLWIETVRNRVFPDTLGRYVFIALIVLGAAFTSRKTMIAVMVALLAFAVPFLVFTNLHIVHNYYQSANAIFLLAAVGIGIGRIFDSSQRLVAITLLVAVSGGEVALFYDRFAQYLTKDYTQENLFQIPQIAKANTTPNDGLLVIGDEWASTIPYYSERKALVIPAWLPRPLFHKMLENPQAFLGERRFGGIVYCVDKLATYEDQIPVIQAYVVGRKVLGQFKDCSLLSPDR